MICFIIYHTKLYVEPHSILSNAMFDLKDSTSRPPTIRDEGRDRLLRRSEHNARHGSVVVTDDGYLGDGIWKGITRIFWILHGFWSHITGTYNFTQIITRFNIMYISLHYDLLYDI